MPQAKKRGFDFIDAPVSGGQAGAENGVLTVMCGGDAAAFARAEPVIAAYARMCRLLGPAGSGQLTKMVNQICIAGLVQGLAEGIHFAKKAGLDVETVIDDDLQGRGAVLADGEPLQDHERRQVRFRLRRRLDAQGPGICLAEARAQRRQPAGDRAGRPVLRRGAGDGRQALGHVEPDRTDWSADAQIQISRTASSSATSTPAAIASSTCASIVGFMWVIMIRRARRSGSRALRTSQVR